MSVRKITRRRLLLAAGGMTVAVGATGLWLGVDRKLLDRRYRNAVDRGDSFSPNVYLSITPDDEVIIWLTRSEMGQGVSTALPMLIAEELEADWSRVRVEQAVAGDHYSYGQLFTAASSSVSSLWVELRRAGAVARHMLVDAAAERWNVSASDCVAAEGIVTHAGSGRSIRFGDLANLARKMSAPVRPRLKTPDQFRLIGQPVRRKDSFHKIDGSAKYGFDVSIPDMRHAAVARPPGFGATVVDFDDSTAKQVPGFEQALALPSGVAVVAAGTWAALKSRDAMKVEWDRSQVSRISNADVDSALSAALAGDEVSVHQDDGKVADILSSADNIVSAEYRLPFLAHACMEPMNTTAEVSDNHCTVWAPTQDPNGVLRLAARITGLEPANIRVHVTGMGGGFGRRTGMDYVEEALRIAAHVEGPVQLVWSREDDLGHGEFREASAHRLEGVLDPAGRISAWRHRLVTCQRGRYEPGHQNGVATMGATGIPYSIPNLQVLWRGAELPVPTRIWRSVGHSYNTFAVESFFDELASAAGQDPVEFRLAHMETGHPRLAACLKRVADTAGWPGPGPSGGTLGVAALSGFGSHLAMMAEVIGNDDGGFAVSHVWCALDCGIAVNPESVIAQIEGGVLYGLDAAMFGKVSLMDGAVENTNFNTYRVMRISEAPQINVSLLPGAEYPGGLGELGTPAIAPAVANALVRSGRERVRRLPFIG